MGISDRLTEFLEYKNISVSKAETLAGVSVGTIRKALQVGKLTEGLSFRILAAFRELNRDWLLTGQGAMINAVDPSGYTLEETPDGPAVIGVSSTAEDGNIKALVVELGKQRQIIETAQGHISMLLQIIEKANIK